jgi:excisionase family DNA binding protein
LERMTLTANELAEYLGVSKDLVYGMVREKTVPFIRIGRRVLFKKDSIDRWFANREECNTK